MTAPSVSNLLTGFIIFYRLENLIVESYDHITDIRSEKRNKSPLEVALSKEYKEIIHLLQEYDQYKV